MITLAHRTDMPLQRKIRLSGINDGYHKVPEGKLASVVTSLEMCEPILRREISPRWSLRHVPNPDTGWYKDLFARLGSDWLWFSRLTMPEKELRTIIQSSHVEIYVLETLGHDEGLLELDFRDPGSCEIAFFAISKELQGQGAGRWLMNRAVEIAWQRPISRLWTHTCTYDHPKALSFYERSGFTAYCRQIEVADDPRVTGHLPRSAAPQIPIL